MVTIQAPAKLNLTLEVLGKRPDGFHEIRSVIQTITLSDSLNFGLSSKIDLRCDMPGWVPEKSLVSKAVRLVQEVTGYTAGIEIEVKKRIPLMSGLGGDSSDAAATLRGLNQLRELGLSSGRLQELALKLGSDVTFFLYGGTALVRGRGEMVTPLSPLPHMWFILLVPPEPRAEGKTGRMYASLSPNHLTEGQATVTLVTSLAEGGRITLFRLFNVFDSIAFDSYPELETYWQQFAEAGAREIHLAGAGPALFTTARDKAEAEKMYRKLHQQGLECYLAESLAR